MYCSFYVQTNVFPTARGRKLKDFKGFLTKVIFTQIKMPLVEYICTLNKSVMRILIIWSNLVFKNICCKPFLIFCAFSLDPVS